MLIKAGKIAETPDLGQTATGGQAKINRAIYGAPHWDLPPSHFVGLMLMHRRDDGFPFSLQVQDYVEGMLKKKKSTAKKVKSSGAFVFCSL